MESMTCILDSDSTWHDFALSLRFGTSLKSLFLMNSYLNWEELAAMVGSLPNLETLKLHRNSVVGSEWSPVEGKFLALKFLSVSRCDDLTDWEAESSHFPALESVFLEGLSKLDEFPSCIGDIPTLERIDLHNCSVALGISAMRMLVEQEHNGNMSIRLDVHCWGDEERRDNFSKQVEAEGLRSDNLRLHLY